MAKNRIKPLTGNAGDFSGIVLKAAARGDVEAVKHYLKINPDWLNQEGPHGRTLLWEAVYKGRTSFVSEILKMGADVNPIGSYYTPMLVELSALAVARDSRRVDLMQLLKAHGAKDDLYAACHRGDLNAIDQFLRDDSSVVNRPAKDEPPHPRMGYLPIHYAVAGMQLGAVRLLIGYGAEIAEHLPLLIDWASGNRALISFLREQATGKSPKAVKSKTAKPKRGVPAIDRPDWMGFPPLVDACRGNHNAPDDPERVRKLLKRGADVNITDHKGKTPLHRSCQAGFEQITNLLLECGAELELADHNGCTPIFDCAHHGRAEVLEFMIERGGRIHHADKRGETPLFAAARGGKINTFTLLLEAGCKLSHRNARNKTVAQILAGLRNMTDARRQILANIEALEHA